MGRIVGRILIFSDFSVFRLEYGLVSSWIVLGTRAVFPNAGWRVHDLHYGPILAIYFLNRGPGFRRIYGFSDFFGFLWISAWCVQESFQTPARVFRMPGWEFRTCIMDRFWQCLVELLGRILGACYVVSWFYLFCIYCFHFGRVSVVMVARCSWLVQVWIIVWALGFGPIVCCRGAGFREIHVAVLSRPACVIVSKSLRAETLVDGLPPADRFGRIFGFSDFSGFRPDFGLTFSGIVPYTRAGFPNTGVRVQDLHYEPVLDICLSNSWAGILVQVMFFICLCVLFFFSYF